jgi:hypothetical protein
LWVGGLWLLHLGVLPVLGIIGLAPLLIDEIGGLLSALLVGFAAACVILQALVLVKAEGLESLWRDMRGQLLLMALYACAMYLRGAHIAAGSVALAAVQLSCARVFGAWCWWYSLRRDGVAGRAKRALDPLHHLKR